MSNFPGAASDSCCWKFDEYIAIRFVLLHCVNEHVRYVSHKLNAKCSHVNSAKVFIIIISIKLPPSCFCVFCVKK